MTPVRPNGRMGGGALPLVATILAVVFAVACGTTTASPSPSGSGDVPHSSSAPAGSGGPAPSGTPWPGNAVLGIEAMGAADGQITAAINDFNQGVAKQDLSLMRKAADGLARVDVLLPNLDKIEIFEPMRPFGDRYGTAIRAISTAAKALRTAIDSGDGPGITRSSQDLLAGLEQYASVQPELASWVEQSIAQKRLLTR
jgi:hypothetical protein